MWGTTGGQKQGQITPKYAKALKSAGHHGIIDPEDTVFAGLQLRIRSRLERAQHLFAEFRGTIDDYNSRSPVQLIERQDEGMIRAKYCFHEPAPPKLDAIAGDVLHRFRACLNDIAYQARLNFNVLPSVGQATVFPILDSQENLEVFLATEWPSACPPALRDAIRTIAPFRSGSEFLWILHFLSEQDRLESGTRLKYGIAWRNMSSSRGLAMEADAGWLEMAASGYAPEINHEVSLFPAVDFTWTIDPDVKPRSAIEILTGIEAQVRHVHQVFWSIF